MRSSSAQRAWAELAEPPCVSHLVVPDHLVGLGPEPYVDPDSDILSTIVGNAGASSGDGLLFLDFQSLLATAPVATHAAGAQHRKLTGNRIHLHSPSGAVQEREFTGFLLSRDITRFVCNPISGELFRLPDIDGTKTTASCHNFGLLTKSSHGRGPPDRFAVADLSEGSHHGEKGSFIMRRFLSQTLEWEKLAPLPSPLPLPRLMSIHSHHEVLAFRGRLWWIDLSWCAISADPFSDRPELRFVELPRGSVRPVPTTGKEFTASLVALGMFRRMGVSEGRLHYVEASQKEPFLLSSFALDDDGSCWTLEHQVALGRLWKEENIPWIGCIDPLNASIVYVIVGDRVLGVDMDSRKVLDWSHLGEFEYQQRTILTTYFQVLCAPTASWVNSYSICRQEERC